MSVILYFRTILQAKFSQIQPQVFSSRNQPTHTACLNSPATVSSAEVMTCNTHEPAARREDRQPANVLTDPTLPSVPKDVSKGKPSPQGSPFRGRPRHSYSETPER